MKKKHRTQERKREGERERERERERRERERERERVCCEMGLLSVGTPLPWEQARKHAPHVRKHGIAQLTNIWRRLKDRKRDRLYWGDEIEYTVVRFDEGSKIATVSLDAHDTLEILENLEKAALQSGNPFPSSWKPEYGRYMLEGTPGQPYGSTLNDLLTVEPNMRDRRKLAQSYLPKGDAVVTITSFPRLGCPGFAGPSAKPTPNDGCSHSIFVSNDAINPHPRFRTLTANIRERRGAKVAINMPIYKDVNTPDPFLERLPPSLEDPTVNMDAVISESNFSCPGLALKEAKSDRSSTLTLPEVIPDALPNHIYMDCMCFGMGCSCLQVTFQACSVEEARRLYDQLAVVTPIMLALSAAAPIFRGYLADVDCRWNVISGSVDDRTREEQSILPLKTSTFQIPKSRYASVSTYLSPGPSNLGCNSALDEYGSGEAKPPKGNFWKPKYNDIPLVQDQEIFRELVANDMDEYLARHYAHLFIRDPLVIFEELLSVDDTTSSDHFENIQSTNWQTMRFKPPPPNSSIGWRVEFRSMEIQLTDFENAAFAVFVVLLTRTILSFDLNLYIPLSKVDENMSSAHHRDAVLKDKFYFRRNIFGDSAKEGAVAESGSESSDVDQDAFDQMTVDEIMNGSKKPPSNGGPTSSSERNFPGLIPLIRSYLATSPIPAATQIKLSSYLDLISHRASGALPTAAKWMRSFVMRHPAYKHDSVVSDEINFDLVRAVAELGNAEGPVAGLSSL
ncbi:glutamate-cysteine ligase-domain-containing protein [Zopfochytrium polystomum]|nr:glutamate-cysteine ligase-domain-containing protein [Zopfochytrium polystomum]